MSKSTKPSGPERTLSLAGQGLPRLSGERTLGNPCFNRDRHFPTGPPAANVVGVFLVAEVRVYLEALALCLEQYDRFRVLGMERDLASALKGIGRLAVRPDLVLLDHGVPEGAAAVRRLHKAWPQLGILVLAVGEADNGIITCAEAGAAGFIPSDASLDEAVEALTVVADGCGFCPPRITGALLRRVASIAEDHPPPVVAHLTRREREVALLLDKGLSNKEISDHLHIRVATVKNHVHSILQKLAVQRRGQVAYVIRAGRGRP